jgi:hypothetical protein
MTEKSGRVGSRIVHSVCTGNAEKAGRTKLLLVASEEGALGMDEGFVRGCGLRELPERFFVATGREFIYGREFICGSETYDQRPSLRNECGREQVSISITVWREEVQFLLGAVQEGIR